MEKIKISEITLQELIKENKAIAALWKDHLMLYNYVDDKMVEGCEQAKELLTKLNK